jgi:hypothetical protein
MGAISRRAALLAAPAAAGSVAVASTRSAEQTITFTTTRAKNTLPLNPPLGAPFIMYLTLHDANNTTIGDGSLFGMVVDVIVDVPPKIVVQVKTILRLADGEIHLSSMRIRKVPDPGVKHPVAIVGGTGVYATARGDGTLEYTTTDTSTMSLKVVTD